MENINLENLDELQNKYLTFIVDGQSYGISILQVMQIIGLQEITAMPEFPDYMKGIINLRGSVIPIMDMRLRLHKPMGEYDERTCIVVAYINEKSVGIIVDEVEEVIDILNENISTPPKVQTVEESFVTGVAKLGNKITLILNLDKIINGKDLEKITK